MPIGFGFSVPSVPGTYIEVLGPAGATGSTSHPVYALGMRTTAATVAADTWTPIPGDGSAASTYFGVGSQAAAVCKAIKAQYPGVDLYCAAQAEEGGGVAATGTITVTVATALSGTIYLRVAGVDLTVAVTAGDAQNTIGANILAALNALPDLPTTQACPANICTLTARHKGLYGNDIKIELNPLGAAGGQVTPGGVTVNIAAMSGGTTEPAITTAIANMVNLAPGVICSPYSECGGSSPGAALKTEMAGRWGALRMQWGHVCTARADTHALLVTWGSSNPAINDPALSCLALYG
ncbi:MAG: hypothetical protein FJ087_16855, partial [Deltaproteobacteria bacterium]|nr:hypothetical protein [Deltaproteobacteria bacterium]